MPCIILRSQGVRMIKIKPKAAGKTAKIPKKKESEYSAEILSIKPPVTPANLFAIADDKNQKPKIKPTKRFGDNLLT